ncbi:MAG: putative metal-dependent enzyme (double-stranded beta helix superfamily) [Myxococcota bacterium]
MGLSDEFAGLWAGLAVNDLSSSVAVGSQFGETGNIIAAGAKSIRIMLLGPALIAFSFLRPVQRKRAGGDSVSPKLTSNFPTFILGYFALFGVRVLGDELAGGTVMWATTLSAATLTVKVLLLAVCAGIGLQIRVSTLIQVGGKAVAVGAAASTGVAGLSLLMLVGFSRGAPGVAVALAAAITGASFVVYRLTATGDALYRPVLRRLAAGAPLSMREAGSLLEYYDQSGKLDVAHAEGVLRQLHPAIGELQPLRTAEGFDSINYRRLIYWQSNRGSGSLVGILWPPGAEAHIHSHSHDGAGKTIEGRVESTHFVEHTNTGSLELTRRETVEAGDLLTLTADAEIHSVRNAGGRDAIGIHFYGPDKAGAGRRFQTEREISGLKVGEHVTVRAEPDHLPSHVHPEPST